MGPGWEYRCHCWPRQPAGSRRCLPKSRAGWSSHLGPCSQRLLPSTPSRHPRLLQAPAPGHSSSAAHLRCQLSGHVEALQQLWKSILLGQAGRRGHLRQQPWARSQQACRKEVPSTAHLCQPVDHQHGLQAHLQAMLRQPLACRVARCL